MSGYSVPIRAGDLKRQIVIQSRSTGKDSFGQSAVTWTNMVTTRAAITPLSGNELIAAQAQFAETTHHIEIRYRTGITAAMRAIYQGRVFNILSVIDDFTAHRRLVLVCSEGLNQG